MDFGSKLADFWWNLEKMALAFCARNWWENHRKTSWEHATGQWFGRSDWGWCQGQTRTRRCCFPKGAIIVSTSRVLNQSAAPKLRPRNTNRTGRHHSFQDGRYTSNRTGYPLCAAYNDGRCETTAQGGWCPSAWDTVHQCSRCLGQHPVTKCPHESMPQPNFLKNQKGRGKGRGIGKSCGKTAHYWFVGQQQLQDQHHLWISRDCCSDGHGYQILVITGYFYGMRNILYIGFCL